MYGWVRYNPELPRGDGTVIPSYYWYYLPEPAGGYTGGWSGYIYGSLTSATFAALSVAQTCYNYHIAETLRQHALGNYQGVELLGGCGGNLSRPYAGSWFLYSGDGPPVFRQYPVWNQYEGSIAITGGATCK